MYQTKAFDNCKFSILFKKINEKVNPVFTRLLIYIYCNQSSQVSFNGSKSKKFELCNGVGQGKVLAGLSKEYLPAYSVSVTMIL